MLPTTSFFNVEETEYSGMRQREKTPEIPFAGNHRLRTHYDPDEVDPAVWVQTRIWFMLVIFCVSLFASTFPSLSRRIPGLRIPGVVFFIGKHFGTGVILSTAFAHLLQDAFEALMSPAVRDRWAVSDYVGMIVLASLLLIFLVEYISTSFVDRLHSYPSAPSSPCASPPPSTSQLPCPISVSPESNHVPTQLPSPASFSSANPMDRDPDRTMDGSTGHAAGAPLPLAPPESPSSVNNESSAADEHTPLHTRPTAYGSTHHHHHHHQDAPPARPRPVGFAHTFPRTARPPRSRSGPALVDAEVFFAGGHHRHEARAAHASHHSSRQLSGWRRWFGSGSEASSADEEGGGERDAGVEVGKKGKGGKGKQRGVRVSEHGHAHGQRHGRGHSGGHGHGHGHSHIHMDMESWGSSSGDEADGEGEMNEEEMKIGRKRQVVGILMLEMGIALHSLVIGLTLSITSGPEFTSLVTAIIFHQLFEGLSLGIRIATLPAMAATKGKTGLLKPILAITFAIMTPAGIAIGLGAFEPGRSEGARVTLVRGLMSALSAGMLVYAACVEMLAGDFVLDPHLWRSSIRRQALALISLLLGVAAMNILGILGE
ncbi:Zinc/iron permease [Wolfiporia cocos MD-104 SS10]|uniref:Zinc/iron permease n=1 Tax=Wolfiporia cocos (strain MD-104) TaxID=742152 RepID=A0A2H3J7T8_WOLCO|nr:Zinc/iron permease [Wolfiporia cocos MD-104 SS10]